MFRRRHNGIWGNRSWRAHSVGLICFLVSVGVVHMIGTSGRYIHVASAANSFEVYEPQSGSDYSNFKHDNPKHARLPCLLCHRRETNDPRPRMPANSDHTPCIGCHAQQFADSNSPICTNCHNDPKAGTLKPFPSLSSFGMRFDHAKHTGGRGGNCATCHRPASGGVALTIPSGFSAHTTCYSCHSPRAQADGRDISSCGTCHQPGTDGSTSTQAVAFRRGFSHAKHDRTESLNCTQCHRVGVGGKQISSPQPLNHHASGRAFSCNSCHNGARAFGGDDFSACKRCHTGNSWRF